ncbi:MAG: class I SAM-dependent methyltransferase [Candidatus Sumerlaeia bacterium]|nr:class I SAM-dependent methyltransferase [Candidatus Sumerlaeia bacterium]
MMKHRTNWTAAAVCVLTAALAFCISAATKLSLPNAQPSDARSPVLARRKALLERLEKGSPDKLNVPPTDGRLLRILVEAAHAQKALELGSSYGYSALWIGSGLEQTGGHLWTIEIDAGRAKECRENIREAGLEKTVTSIEDDAFKAIPQLAKEGPWDFVFLDAWKSDYKRYLDVLLPQMKAGGVIVAHNTIERAGEMPDYLEAVFNTPALDSVTLSTTEWKCGLTLTYVRKKPSSDK